MNTAMQLPPELAALVARANDRWREVAAGELDPHSAQASIDDDVVVDKDKRRWQIDPMAQPGQAKIICYDRAGNPTEADPATFEPARRTPLLLPVAGVAAAALIGVGVFAVLTGGGDSPPAPGGDLAGAADLGGELDDQALEAQPELPDDDPFMVDPPADDDLTAPAPDPAQGQPAPPPPGDGPPADEGTGPATQPGGTGTDPDDGVEGPDGLPWDDNGAPPPQPTEDPFGNLDDSEPAEARAVPVTVSADTWFDEWFEGFRDAERLVADAGRDDPPSDEFDEWGQEADDLWGDVYGDMPAEDGREAVPTEGSTVEGPTRQVPPPPQDAVAYTGGPATPTSDAPRAPTDQPPPPVQDPEPPAGQQTPPVAEPAPPAQPAPPVAQPPTGQPTPPVAEPPPPAQDPEPPADQPPFVEPPADQPPTTRFGEPLRRPSPRIVEQALPYGATHIPSRQRMDAVLAAVMGDDGSVARSLIINPVEPDGEQLRGRAAQGYRLETVRPPLNYGRVAVSTVRKVDAAGTERDRTGAVWQRNSKGEWVLHAWPTF